MAKLKITDNSSTSDDDSVVSPTQTQMDSWVTQELAEAEADNMLQDESPQIIFKDTDSDQSID